MGEGCLEAGGEVGTEGVAGAVCVGEGFLEAWGEEIGTESVAGQSAWEGDA